MTSVDRVSDLRSFLISKGVRYDEIIKDGKIARDEIQGQIGGNLFDLIDSGMRVGGRGDGVLTPEELQHAWEVINRYAEILGITFGEAFEKYKSAQSFKNVSLSEMAEAKSEIVSSLQDKSINSGENLKGVLTGLGYGQDVVEAVVKLINDYQNLSVETVAGCVMRVVEAARMREKVFGVEINRHFPAVEYSKDNILAWLKGQEVSRVPGPEETINDSAITEDSSFKAIFGWYGLNGGSARKQAAIEYLKRLIEEGKLAMAKRALKLIKAKAQENGYMSELLALENDGYLNELFASAYLNQGKLGEAFEHIKKLSADYGRRQQLLSELLNKSLENISSNYDLAFRVVEAMGINKEINYAQIAARCLESDNQNIRKCAVEILENKIPSTFSFSGPNAREVLATFSSLGINIPRTSDGSYQAMAVADLLAQVKLSVLVRPEIWRIQPTLINVNPLAQAPFDRISLKEGTSTQSVIEAINRLKSIADDNSTDPYNKAYAHYVKGMLLYGLAKSSTGKVSFTVNGQTVEIEAKELLKEAMYELRLAWEGCMNGQNLRQETEYLELARNIFGRMVDIVDGTINSNAWGKADASKKLGKELAGFIPNYALPSVTYIAYSTSQNSANRPRNPAQYRNGIGIGNKDAFSNFHSQLNPNPSQGQGRSLPHPTQGRNRPRSSSPGDGGRSRSNSSSSSPAGNILERMNER